MRTAAPGPRTESVVTRRQGIRGGYPSLRSLPISTAIVAAELNKTPPATPELTRLARLLRVVKSVPFFMLHLACLAVFFTGVHPFDLVLCGLFYFIRMFGITGG